MKLGYTELFYNQSNKDEPCVYYKRLFEEYVTSKDSKNIGQVNYYYMYYNMHRLTNLVIIVMISTYP